MDNSDASSSNWNVDGLSIVQRIILAAIMSVCGTGIVLLCSYMCCTAFFAYQRRRRHGDARFVGMGDMLQLQQHRDMEAQRVQCGIDPDVLEAMPVFVFGEEGRGDRGRLECAVCLGEFRVGEKGRVLPLCRHSFHKECIDMWLYSHSTCPLCRGNMNCKS